MRASSGLVLLGLLCSGLLAAGGAHAANTVECGAVPIRNVVKTSSDPVSRSATGFATVPGATTTVSVAQGATSCVKVRFSVDANATGPGIVRVIAISGSSRLRLHPIDDGLVYLTGASGRGSHDYEWVRAFGPGNYVIAVQWRVRNSGTTFTIHNWTMDVEVR